MPESRSWRIVCPYIDVFSVRYANKITRLNIYVNGYLVKIMPSIGRGIFTKKMIKNIKKCSSSPQYASSRNFATEEQRYQGTLCHS